MIDLQLLVTVPQWAVERCLNEESFNILEQIVLTPNRKDQILSKVEYGTACCILQALEYGQDKGLL